MRHVLRTALATAVVAGVALTPVVTATTALAAPSVPKSAAAKTTETRYSGYPVYLAKGYVAVLRNRVSDGGPEAWIRAVNPNWQRGDDYMGRLMAKLDRDTTSATVDGLRLSLRNLDGDVPLLKLDGAGESRTIMLPERKNDVDGVLVSTVPLKGGLTAMVYRYGSRHVYYGATVLKGKDNEEIGHLKAGGGYALKDTKVFNGIQVTLDFRGDVTSVQDHGSDGQGPETPVGTDLGKRKLADGTYGELWKRGTGWYVLELGAKDGKQRGSLSVGGPNRQGVERGAQVGGMWVGVNTGGKVGSWLNPAGGFDGEVDSTKGCTAFRTSGTPFKGLSLRLSNGPGGAVAEVLNVNDGSVYDRLSTGDMYGLLDGAQVRDLPSGPTFRMRVHGGKSAWAAVKFPQKPAGRGCAVTTGTSKTAGTGVGAQTVTAGTRIVPKGAVAAGAEVEEGKDGNTALVAGGAGLASVGLAGLGFVAMRRRAGARG
ncbi:hypothetical protein A8W25_19025 [Streptomyces sp. ERV7]|uniref:hypothetical protein n=1 Tax=Streptomyces sp. ERV7 TaxID=1322334 RepID=UPI0007F33917|nr:hypothetical protein [Streptomyces sp. ERV7]OAR24487.1 hypothetical protein A8W25_19025 [Streptomyces sp. ERV7]